MRLSIIVPVYNVESYLRRCIDSILRQTMVDFELIIVDDGSEDNSPQICEEYRKIDSRIVVIHKENGGLSSARNAGLEIARGDYIAFVDSDDWISPLMYEKLLDGIELTGSDIAMCGYIYSDGIEEKTEKIADINELLIDSQFANAIYTNRLRSFAWNKIYKRNLIINRKFEVGRCYEDVWFMNLIAGDVKKAYLLQDCLYYYFQRSDSITHDMTVKSLKNMMDYFEALKERKVICNNYSEVVREKIDIEILCVFYQLARMSYLFSEKGLYLCTKSWIKNSVNIFRCLKRMNLRTGGSFIAAWYFPYVYSVVWENIIKKHS